MSAIEEQGKIVAVLRGHVDQDTAFMQEDYPYGQLKCKRRLWIETATKGAKKGESRFVAQTTNPKKPGEYWNKPHPGQYSMFLFMAQYENGHVDSVGMHHPWLYQWIHFYNLGIWNMLTLQERKSIAAAVIYFRRGSTIEWGRFANDYAAIKANDLRTEEDWKRATLDESIQSLYADFEKLRTYIDLGGPDVTAKKWWLLPGEAEELVDLDA
jgi:hypothetical protein